MPFGYEINDLAKEESWRMFRIIGELVEGFDKLSGMGPAVTIYGSARIQLDDPLYVQTQEITRRLGELGFSIITGGGPGVMEAANRGALEAGVTSVGLNIELPEEQACNPYSHKDHHVQSFLCTQSHAREVCHRFHHHARGLGTLDELTEVLTLMQTHKIRPFPVILSIASSGTDFWTGEGFSLGSRVHL